MNRPLLIAAFALLFAPVSVLAQHGGGGHAGAGGHAGFGGGFASHASGGVRSGGFATRSYASRSYAPRSYARSSAFARGSIGTYGRYHSGIGVRIRSYPYGYNCWGGYCGYGYGFWGYPYLGGGVDPYWWWDNGDNDSNNGYDQAQPYGYDDGLANQMQQQGIPMRPAPDAGQDS